MKKKIITIIIVCITIILSIISLAIYYEKAKYSDHLTGPIVTKNWQRAGENDEEHIVFTEDGEFTYYCSCGNGVGNYDTCDTYKYDKETKTIKLNCSSKNLDDTVVIKKVTEYNLELEIDGKTIKFESDDIHMKTNQLDFAGKQFISKDKNITILFDKTGAFEAYDKKKQEFALGSANCWYWFYDKENQEITLECNDETKRTIKVKDIKKENNKITEIELYFTKEKQTIIFENKK